MLRYFSLLIGGSLCLWSCTPTAPTRTLSDYEGAWIMHDKTSRILANQSTVGIGQLEELVIERGTDSLLAIDIGSNVAFYKHMLLPNGELGVLATPTDTAKFGLSTNGDTLRSTQANGSKNVFVKAAAQYVRPIEPLIDHLDATTLYLNDKLFAGTYTLNGKKITLLPDGTITGWELFNRYDACISGICAGSCGESSVSLYKNGEAEDSKTFVWAYFSDGLRLYATENTSKEDAIPFYKRTALQYELLR